MDKSRFFENPDFCQKSRFENKLAVFRKVLKFEKSCTILWHSLFDAVPGVVVPELNCRRSAEIWISIRLRPNIEKITNKNNVSDVMRDQMSPKKEGTSPRIIPHPSHLPESHFY